MKATVTFPISLIKGTPDAHLRLRVSIDGHRTEINLGYRITVSGWNYDTQRCRRNTLHGIHHAQKINAFIENVEQKVLDLISVSPTVTPADLRNLIHPQTPIEDPKNDKNPITEVIDSFISSQKVRWAQATTKKFITLKKSLYAYRDTLEYIEDVTVSALHAYMVHRSAVLSNPSLNKEFKNIRWFLRWALDNGYTFAPDAAEYNPKLKVIPRKVIFLEWDELMALYSYPLPNLHHQEVRDAFCLGCFTGLRFSDLHALRRSDVHADHLAVTTLKDGDPVDIPLTEQSAAILARYSHEDFNGHALPVCNNAEFNETIKEVAHLVAQSVPSLMEEFTLATYKSGKRIEVTKPKYGHISAHTARRTFICQSLQLGIPAEVVMSITGHADYHSMKPYIAITKDTKAAAMSRFNRPV